MKDFSDIRLGALNEQYEIAKSLGQEDEFFKSYGVDIQKSQKANIGDVHIWNGEKFKKQPNGKWRRVSEHGMTKEEHEKKVSEHRKIYEDKNKRGEDDESTGKEIQLMKIHSRIAKEELDSKDYSDEEVGLGKKEVVSRKNHEDLLRLVGDIEVNNKKGKRLNQNSIDEVFENLKGDKPDYNKALQLIQDYAVNDRGKTIKTESIWSLSDKIEAELDKN